MIRVDVRTGDQETRRSKMDHSQSSQTRRPEKDQTRKQIHERITERQVRNTRRAPPKDKAERKERERERRKRRDRHNNTITAESSKIQIETSPNGRRIRRQRTSHAHKNDRQYRMQIRPSTSSIRRSGSRHYSERVLSTSERSP